MAEINHSAISSQDAENVVRAMGLVINNTSLYSNSHSVTKKALDDCYDVVTVALQKYAELAFSISEESLVLNDRPIELKNPLMKMFVSNLEALEISNFAVTRGIDREQLVKLMDVMNSKPDDLRTFGGLSAAITKFDMKNVRASTVTYVKVTADEIVVNKDELAHAVKHMDTDVEGIISYLRGQGGNSETLVQGIRAVASDADKLTDMILKAADAEGKPIDLNSLDSTAGTALAGCLRLTYDALAAEASKTQKGKKELKKILVEVEKDLLERIKKTTGTFSEDDVRVISETIEELQDELEIEGLVADYMKKRHAIENNENRILRFLRVKGLDRIKDTDLEEKLQQGGLSMDGWIDLLVKSGAGEGEGAGIAAVGHLAMLLEQMEESVRNAVGGAAAQADGNSDGTTVIMRDVDKEVQKMVLRTEKKIQDLVGQIKSEAAEAGDVPAGKSSPSEETKLSRKKLLERLAEIVQELCQPLSVINCAVQMILAGTMGSVTGPQSEMLKLADESGKKLQVLIDHLTEMSGVPKGLRPDQEIQSSIYGS